MLKTAILPLALMLLTLPSFCQDQGGSQPPQAAQTVDGSAKHGKHGRSAKGEAGSGSADIGKGAGKGAGDLAAGTGKGAADVATLHPVEGAGEIGKGGAKAGKNVGVGAAKGTGKLAKGAGKGIKHIF